MREVNGFGRLASVAVLGAVLGCASVNVQAQSSDDMAIPVRKGGSKASTSKTADADKADSAKSEEKKSSVASKSSESSESKEPATPAKSSALQRLQSAQKIKTEASETKTAESKSESEAEPKAEAKTAASSSSRSERSESAEKKSESAKSVKEESAGDDDAADVAAIKNLRPASKSADKSERAGSSSSSSESAKTIGKEEASSSAATEAAEAEQEEGDAGPAVATVPAPVFNTNVYLPQAPEKRSLLSRIFNRQKEQPVSLRPQSNFSSDYATRGDAIMPAVLDGNGLNGQDIPIGSEDTYRLASLPSTFRPTDLVQLPIERCHYKNQLYLRREAANALMNMCNEAASQGFNIKVVSAYRDYGHQLRLYNQAVARSGEKQKTVARPGKSEHHLGTTVDLTNNEKHALKRSFGETPEGRWLAANAHRFGWKMTVMSGTGRRSHNDEPWHLRYLGGALNAPAGPSNIAQQNSQPQRTGILGSVARLFGFGRR